MKLLLLLLTLSIALFCQSQPYGKITSAKMNVKPKERNIYFYEPPANLLLPDSLEALIAFTGKEKYEIQYAHLSKVGKKYRFNFLAPDSVSVLLITIVNARVNLSEFSPFFVFKKTVIDNNSGHGFIVNLYDKNGNLFSDNKIQLAELLPQLIYYMDLNEITNKLLIEMYENTYKKYPALRTSDSYADYLYYTYQEDKKDAKERLIEYANKKVNKDANEQNLLEAIKIFGWLKLNDIKQKFESNILQNFPNGQFAKKKYWDNFYSNNRKTNETPQTILADMKDYITLFRDSSKIDNFYFKIMNLLFDKSDWDGVLKYEQLISDKSSNAYSNNKYAKKIVVNDVNISEDNLKIAQILSGKALRYMEAEKQAKKDNADMSYLLGAYYSYLNTYTTILFKLSQFDSAFYYQDMMYRKGNVLTTEGLEHYTLYAEKTKGIDFTRQVLERELLNGIKSQTMLSQLQVIYKRLNLPENEFDSLQKRNLLLSKQKNAANIKNILGTTKASDFALKNLNGETIVLSKLKNKIVVLDFWATWCGPCKASFPNMQKLINQYESDTSVVFLFIDVWERDEPKKVREIVAKYMKENKYSFNILFDEKGKTLDEYKIRERGIPQKIIVNKDGEIVFISDENDYLNDISSAIEAAKR